MLSKKNIFAAALACAALPVFAAPVVVPTFTSFGTFSAATFGGTGIPNTDVAITVFDDGKVTMGLTVTPRYFNEAPTNNGAGLFTAPAGIDSKSPSGQSYAMWNFDFYVGGSDAGSFTYKLFWDVDTALTASLDQMASQTIKPTGKTPVAQNSENLGMTAYKSFGGMKFDPTLDGTYTFALLAYDKSGNEVARTAIEVDVGQVVRNDAAAVPEPATLALVGVALLGLAAGGRRSR